MADSVARAGTKGLDGIAKLSLSSLPQHVHYPVAVSLSHRRCSADAIVLRLLHSTPPVPFPAELFIVSSLYMILGSLLNLTFPAVTPHTRSQARGTDFCCGTVKGHRPRTRKTTVMSPNGFKPLSTSPQARWRSPESFLLRLRELRPPHSPMRHGLRSLRTRGQHNEGHIRSPGARATAHRAHFRCDFAKTVRLTVVGTSPAHHFPMECLRGRAQHTSSRSARRTPIHIYFTIPRLCVAAHGTRHLQDMSDARSDVAHAQALHIARERPPWIPSVHPITSREPLIWLGRVRRQTR
ncbi:hypothetical protein DFP72DRAFT_853621 [Ephemerocybe angulata]|uniref:Uncharacterized protein n=1 Tax=Ephemerocybe angulata TaxID=980116 RepID=A0A8H6HKW3_9AGAR|nr:hypothetical protein DFP72DRAFT_853621 [Tulosesus angulatus]